MHILIRVFGTLAVTALLTYPLWAPQWGAGLLGEIFLVPFPGNLALVLGFLALVALYCATLQRTLRLTGARGNVVWWMFAIPANFVEDFYIIHGIGQALRPRCDARRLRTWLMLGNGWCVLQILSLFPGHVGMSAGLLAIALWLAHWRLTIAINRSLR
ncbi:hypothetical protein KDH83_28345 [Achromobacter sp. Marseille-Q0513]|uniref:hypothetical protein n=1 Tax=Achromobacter sp. Marseille-Q0513 TaxID=2829161 RepID=UPI001B98E77D|nr:hypothetical protein [Achromobacter sp. Marseille-Q0513]MBR8657234.1 hypothetical protein [Achromobacter sp. Marseille-Q0513]